MFDKALKTEQPTLRRIDRARREGQFPSARQFIAAVQFVVFVLMAAAWGPGWLGETFRTTRLVFARALSRELEPADLGRLCPDLLWRTFAPLLAAGCILMAVTLALQLAVTRMGLSLKRATPDVKRLNPLARLRELPRQNLPALLQAAALLPVFSAAVYFIVKDNVDGYLSLPLKAAAAGARHLSGSVEELLWKASGAFLVIGIIDLVRQRRLYRKDLRMTKQEVREEIRELEGNPLIKARIRRLGRELLRRRMMREVPTATAVVVNPTHYAVALRYQLQSMTAPLVVAKGKNYLALRIRQKALEHSVPLVENPPLAQALYTSVEVGQEIPAKLYRAVAEVLAYIYRLMNGRLPG